MLPPRLYHLERRGRSSWPLLHFESSHFCDSPGGANQHSILAAGISDASGQRGPRRLVCGPVVIPTRSRHRTRPVARQSALPRENLLVTPTHHGLRSAQTLAARHLKCFLEAASRDLTCCSVGYPQPPDFRKACGV